MKPEFILLIICLIFMTSFLIMRTFKIGVRSLVLKTATSLAICASGLILSYYYNLGVYSIFVIIGMMFGVLGDNVLDLKMMYKEDAWKYLYYGFISFGIGHLVYAFGLSNLLINNYHIDALTLTKGMLTLIPLTIIVVIGSLLAFKMFKCDFGKDKVIVIIYDFVLSFMTLYSLYASIKCNNLLILFVGFVLFLASDAVLSLIYFGGKEKSKFLAIVNHVFYYVAQIIIVFSMIVVAR